MGTRGCDGQLPMALLELSPYYWVPAIVIIIPDPDVLIFHLHHLSWGMGKASPGVPCYFHNFATEMAPSALSAMTL